ncbi:MBL fold metallo-hydrolase [Ancylomarina salipaludis]|uniref:MBL fold metallo-hydrolase n=1 Tax=Ancylomarina salipaludis TaxID=2501299 RepID=A0A4Q1JL79_9BACT|nr:MBL fold metallo-hydrolase [Ancylomarina salipaludis]RXQ92255.1 MBL fold metallo-hydrolase [Ancylomarina salipaludis]
MKKYIWIIILTLTSLIAHSEQNNSLIKVTNRLYMISGYGGNVSFLVTEEGVVVIDSGSQEMYGQKIESLIKSITNKPIKYIILTHFHIDHTLGACGFSGNPIIIAHQNLATNLRAHGQNYIDRNKNKYLIPWINSLKENMNQLKQNNDPKWMEIQKQYNSASERLENISESSNVYPLLSFTSEMKLFLGSDTLRLFYPGKAHTNCNIMVEFINQKALATGDLLFNKCLPYIDSNADSDTQNWIKQLVKYSQKDYQYIISGHGALGNTQDLQLMGQYLTELRSKVEAGIASQMNLKELLLEVKMPEYSHWGFQTTLAIEIEALYKELSNQTTK